MHIMMPLHRGVIISSGACALKQQPLLYLATQGLPNAAFCHAEHSNLQMPCDQLSKLNAQVPAAAHPVAVSSALTTPCSSSSVPSPGRRGPGARMHVELSVHSILLFARLLITLLNVIAYRCLTRHALCKHLRLSMLRTHQQVACAKHRYGPCQILLLEAAGSAACHRLFRVCLGSGSSSVHAPLGWIHLMRPEVSPTRQTESEVPT